MDTKIELLEKIFPEVITEKNFDGEIRKAVDFDKLKDILTDNISDAPEAYNFTWVGKNAARAKAYERINKTLRPCVEESLNFDTTQNLYIEGDNLEVLKLLQQPYMHKVKMIYIDPPYNTGHNFIYKNNFNMNESIYNKEIELFDDDENKNFVENTESNPRFHSDWCSMIYSRLLLARNLLTDDGVIFISIDDNEQANLKKICDEVLGEENFISSLIWEKADSPKMDPKFFSSSHDFILVYGKYVDKLEINKEFSDEVPEHYNKIDENGRRYYLKPMRVMGGNVSESLFYPMIAPDGTEVLPISSTGEKTCWRWSKKKVAEESNRIEWVNGRNGWSLYFRIYEDSRRGTPPMTVWHYQDVGSNRNSKAEIKKIFSDNVFDTPKPTRLIKKILQIGTDKDAIVLDFFSGSATTAHAVMALNAEDGGNRKFIMVQLPETCAENSEAYKAGYKNICEIGKERIRRAGAKIKADSPLTTENLDVGFRVFKVDETNFKNINVVPAELTQEMLKNYVNNIKPDRNSLDLLFECLLKWAVAIHYSVETETFDGATIHTYGGNNLVACFDENISLDVVKHIAQKKPMRVVFRDACFYSDAQKINAVEILKHYWIYEHIKSTKESDIKKYFKVI